VDVLVALNREDGQLDPAMPNDAMVKNIHVIVLIHAEGLEAEILDKESKLWPSDAYNTTSQPTMNGSNVSPADNVQSPLMLLAILRLDVQRYHESSRPFRADVRAMDPL
jgi:hypothetical protein